MFRTFNNVFIFLLLAASCIAGPAPFAFIKTAGAGSSGPAFVQEIARHASAAGTTAASHSYTLANGAAVGERVVVCVFRVSSDITTLTDSAGNTYTMDEAGPLFSGFAAATVYSAPVTSALTAGQSITVTWNGDQNKPSLIAVTASGTTALDSETSTWGYTTAAVATVTTTAPTVAICFVYSNSNYTVNTPDGTEIGTTGTNTFGGFYKNSSSAGSLTVGTTVSSIGNMGRVLCAYK